MAKKMGNPFLDTDFSQYLSVGKFAEQFKLPGVDTNAFLQTQQKNFGAMAKANQVALEGVQALAQRQSEIVRRSLEESATAVRELTTPGTPEEKIEKQTELFKQAFETGLANFRELAEMSVKSNSEAAELLNQRVSQGLDELKAVIKTAA